MCYTYCMIEEGKLAPDFTLPDENGNETALSSLDGQIVVLYFYPKDNTPGCTKEACSLRDTIDDLAKLDATVIGISPDSSASHIKFKEKHNLPFHLLSDPEHKVMEMYGAYGEKMLYGKKTTGVIRSTFLIGEDGKILHPPHRALVAQDPGREDRAVFPEIPPDHHFQQPGQGAHP